MDDYDKQWYCCVYIYIYVVISMTTDARAWSIVVTTGDRNDWDWWSWF